MNVPEVIHGLATQSKTIKTMEASARCLLFLLCLFHASCNDPPSDPVITGYVPGQQPQDGDILVCTVSGGTPPVENVLFTCHEPPLPDQEDVRTNQTTVSSNVTLTNVTRMVCVCTALWPLDPNLHLSASAVYPLPGTDDSGIDVGVIVGGVVLAVGVICIILALLVLLERKGRLSCMRRNYQVTKISKTAEISLNTDGFQDNPEETVDASPSQSCPPYGSVPEIRVHPPEGDHAVEDGPGVQEVKQLQYPKEDKRISPDVSTGDKPVRRLIYIGPLGDEYTLVGK